MVSGDGCDAKLAPAADDPRFLEKTDDDLAQLPFKLHDFGARGVSSAESAAIGGAAHLVNFMGSDTVLGVLAANRFYREPMAAYSVPAAARSRRGAANTKPMRTGT